MSWYVCSLCGADTTNPNGLCLKHEIEQKIQKEKEKEMEPNKKVCVECKEEYTPSSNVQKRCPDCKEKLKPPTKYKKKNNKSTPLPDIAVDQQKGGSVFVNLSKYPLTFQTIKKFKRPENILEFFLESALKGLESRFKDMEL